MKHIAKRTLSIFLVLLIIGGYSVSMFSSAADEGGKVPTRVNCTINGDSSTARGFSWATTVSANTDLEISIDGENPIYFSGKESTFKDYFIHKVTATGLKAGEYYSYRVGDKAAGIWSDYGQFKTNAGKGNATRFIAIADVQASNQENFRRGANVLANAIEFGGGADFIVNLGDYVNDCTNDEWNWYFEEFKFANAYTTNVPVAGNHDGNLKWNWFQNMFNLEKQKGSVNLTGTFYSFDYGDAHFAVLNTNDMYPMSMQQRNWLINDMKASDAKWKIVFQHRSMYSAGKNINKPDTLIMRNLLLPIMEDLDIDMVFAGHDHMYFRTQQIENETVQPVTTVTEVFNGEETEFVVNPDGIMHILPNTAGTKRYHLYEAMDPILDCAALAYQPGKPVYTVIDIEDGYLVYKAYTVDEETNENVLIDKYAIKKTVFGSASTDKPLNTDYITTIPAYVTSFIYEFTRVIFVDYLTKLLPQAIMGLFK